MKEEYPNQAAIHAAANASNRLEELQSYFKAPTRNVYKVADLMDHAHAAMRAVNLSPAELPDSARRELHEAFERIKEEYDALCVLRDNDFLGK